MLLKECCWVTFYRVWQTQVGRVVPVSQAHFLLHDIMSLTVSSVLPCLVCLLCVFLVPAESGEFLLWYLFHQAWDLDRCVRLLSAVTTVSVYQSVGSTLTLSSLYPRSCLTDESCLSFVDTYGVTHDAEKCNKYCCGTCNLRYCCKDKPKQLNQESCSGSLARCGLLFNLFFVMQMWVEIKAFFHVLIAVQAKLVWLWESP